MANRNIVPLSGLRSRSLELGDAWVWLAVILRLQEPPTSDMGVNELASLLLSERPDPDALSAMLFDQEMEVRIMSRIRQSTELSELLLPYYGQERWAVAASELRLLCRIASVVAFGAKDDPLSERVIVQPDWWEHLMPGFSFASGYGLYQRREDELGRIVRGDQRFFDVRLAPAGPVLDAQAIDDTSQAIELSHEAVPSARPAATAVTTKTTEAENAPIDAATYNGWWHLLAVLFDEARRNGQLPAMRDRLATDSGRDQLIAEVERLWRHCKFVIPRMKDGEVKEVDAPVMRRCSMKYRLEFLSGHWSKWIALRGKREVGLAWLLGNIFDNLSAIKMDSEKFRQGRSEWSEFLGAAFASLALERGLNGGAAALGNQLSGELDEEIASIPYRCGNIDDESEADAKRRGLKPLTERAVKDRAGAIADLRDRFRKVRHEATQSLD